MRKPIHAAFALVALAPLAAGAGFFSGVPALLPLACAAPAWIAMVTLLKHRRRGSAVAAMLLWALLVCGSEAWLCALYPERGGNVVLHGPAYWAEMRGWIETGLGRESDPRAFLPQHLLHAGAFAALSLATGSLVSIIFGAVLVGYMSNYVGQMIVLAPAHPILTAILAWHPWSVVRVVSFVILGVFLAEPVVSRLQGSVRPIGRDARWIVAAMMGLLLDVVLKSLLAPHWPALLRSLR